MPPTVRTWQCRWTWSRSLNSDCTTCLRNRHVADVLEPTAVDIEPSISTVSIPTRQACLRQRMLALPRNARTSRTRKEPPASDVAAERTRENKLPPATSAPIPANIQGMKRDMPVVGIMALAGESGSYATATC